MKTLHIPPLRGKRWGALCLLVTLGLATVGGAVWLDGQQSGLAGKLVRLHVLANSDDPADQALKLAVRDAVLEEAQPLLGAAAGMEEAHALLYANLDLLAGTARGEIARQGYDYPVWVSLEETWFPTRAYDGFALPAGRYQALRVVIGQGAGQNWWCVVFPPLCLASATQQLPQAAQQAGLTEQEVALIAEAGESYVIKFKAIELWEELKARFAAG